MMLDAVPPGHEPTSTMPRASSGGRPMDSDSNQAMNGIRMNCRATPSVTGFGLLITFRKSSGSRVIPMPSMTRPSSGTMYPLKGSSASG